MAKLILILGGARSGKSRFAQQLAERIGGNEVLFVATAEPRDDEMAQRIRMHQNARPPTWPTLEAPSRVGKALAELKQRSGVILIDCLTLLVSNILLSCGDVPNPHLAEERVAAEIELLISVTSQHEGTVIMVSGEVGLGLVPESPLGRIYRDLLGRTNQTIAARSDATYLLVAGLAVELKRLALTVDQITGAASIAEAS